MSAPLRILVLMNRIPFPLNDGGAIGSFNFVKGYAEAGCEVHVLAMNTAKHFVERELLQDNLLKYAQLDDVYVDNRPKAIPALLNILSGESYITQRFKSIEFGGKLVQLLKEKRFDLVHIDGLPCALYADMVKKYGLKMSYRAHNVEHIIWERVAEQETNPLKKWYWKTQAKRLKKFEKEALAKMDVVMAISREDDEAIKAFCPAAKTKLVPAGMDVSDEMPVSHSSVNPLFFIGSFDWMPNLQGIDWFFKHVWSSLLSAFPQLHFNIAGKKMPEHILKLKSEHVSPVGEVPDAKAFILSGGIMVVPIVSGSGIRIKILEAMALGKCIVATSIAAEGLGLKDGKNVLIANDAGEFVTKIGRCLQEPAYVQEIAQNAHTFALENFQNKKIFSDLTSYYLRLTAAG